MTVNYLIFNYLDKCKTDTNSGALISLKWLKTTVNWQKSSVK
jgi:hypothetical protein